MNKVRIIITAVFFIGVAVLPAYSQVQSKDNNIGDWSDPTTWLGPLPALVNIAEDIIVYGYVTADNVSLDSGFGSAITSLEVYDTLVVEDELQIGALDDVYVAPEGVLVILGDIQTQFLAGLINEGTTVIKGQVDDYWNGFLGDPYIYNSGNLYVYDVDPEFYPNAGTNQTYSSSSQLQTENPALYDFVEGNGAEPLPVEVIYFKANQQKEEVFLQWATSLEINFDYFEIARTVDTKTFTVLGEVPGAGNSDQENTYQFIDSHPPFGDVYYRLVAVDLDGSREDHGIAHEHVTLLSESKQITFYPNPLKHSKLVVNSPVIEGEGLFELINQHGKLVFSEAVKSGKNEFTIPANLPAGIYYVRIKHGELAHNKPLILQK